MSTEEFMLKVLGLFATADLCHEVWWRTDTEFAPITFMVNCNDFFYYASADCEAVTEENLPVLEQAMKDCTDAKGNTSYEASLLFCARVRNMKPLREYLAGGSHKLEYSHLFENLDK